MNGLFAELDGFDKTNMKKTTVRVRTRDGKIHEETLCSEGIQASYVADDIIPQYLNDSDQGFSRLPIYSFQQDSWKLNSNPQEAQNEEKLNSSRIVCVTYNVWFRDWYLEERAEALIRLVQTHEADILCLQEVTPRFIEVFTANTFIRQNYQLSEAQDRTVYPYGVLIASRFPITELLIYTMPSNMGRRLLKASILVNEMTLEVCTAHLESMANANMRIEQLDIVWNALKDADNSIFMGDTNIYDNGKEVQHFDKSYLDIWRHLKGEEHGPTCGEARIDRVFCRSERLRPEEIEIIGKDPIADNLPNVKPSDHYGLVTVFTDTQVN